MADVKPTHLAQVAVTIRDLERAKAFYRDALELKHLFDAPPGLAFFQCGQTRLMLSQPEGPETVGNSILYYGVEDVAAAHRALAGKGVAFEEEPRCIAKIEGRDVWLAICRDSEGNLLGLMSG
ncbi:MAG TPA: VOC family protein [Allosphingosinicella sp.]|jgi:methylmalonyl-CoA/ethylmalonyl-CoA epimerase